MNTTQQGDIFEQKIFDYFSKLIEEGLFVSPKECCRIYRKKKYFSKTRGKSIIFDIAIEVHLPGASEPSMRWVIECKSCGKAGVPVDDAEEFYAKLDQIGIANCKGIIASSGKFQAGTIAYSKSQGIGLLRNFELNSFKWDLARSISTEPMSLKLNNKRSSARLLTDDIVPNNFCDYVFYHDGHYFTSLYDFLAILIKSAQLTKGERHQIEVRRPAQFRNVPFLSYDSIDHLASNVLESLRYSSGPVDADALCQAVHETYGFSILRDIPKPSSTQSIQVLGRIDFDEQLITVYDDNNIHRNRFTLAHEIGHLCLKHADFLSREQFDISDINQSALSTAPAKSSNILRMEHQANYFASSLLMPKAPFLKETALLFLQLDIKKKGNRFLYVDDQECNIRDLDRTLSRLSTEFCVSKTAVKIRLSKLNMLQFAPGLSRPGMLSIRDSMV